MHRIGIALFTASFGFASAKMTAKDVDLALESYRKAPAVRAKVKKTVAQETMGTETRSEGEFYFSKGKLRMDIHEPEQTTLVYDGKTFWMEAREDDAHVVVMKMPGTNLKKSDSILASLFDRKDVLKGFNLQDTTAGIYHFEAKDKKKADVISLDIVLKGKDILRIAYKDQLENKVTLDFSDLKRGKVDGDKFKYSPPKNAEVTEP